MAIALDERDFKRAMQLRGHGFMEILDIYLRVRRMRCKQPPKVFRVAVLVAGAPAAGMNAAAKTVIRELINYGHVVMGVHGGFLGLARGDMRQLQWGDVSQWAQLGGAALGTNRTVPSDIKALPGGLAFISRVLKEKDINALMVIGGFEGYTGLLELAKGREDYPSLKIPMCCIPATISNNVPGTDFTLGSDTALNCIVDAIDRLKLSAASSCG